MAATRKSTKRAKGKKRSSAKRATSKKRSSRKGSTRKKASKRVTKSGMMKAAKGGLNTVRHAGERTWETLKSTTAQVVEGVRDRI